MKAIILAGGFATRLWPLTEKTVKPLLHIAGKPILSYIIEVLPPTIPIIISTNTFFVQDFEEWKREYSLQRDITIFCEDAHSEERKKGALGAISLVIDSLKIQDDLLVLAGDNLFLFDFKKFLSRAKKNPLLAAYDIQDKKAARAFGVLIPYDKHFIQEFQEKPEEPKSTLVSTGALYFPKKNLSSLQEYATEKNDDLGGVFEYFLSKKQPVEYFSFSEPWFDIGSFSTFLEAQKYIIGNQVIVKKESICRKNTYHGSVYIASGAIVENSLLENAIIESGVVLRNATIRNSIIGKNATIINTEIVGTALREESFIKN